MTRHDPGAQKKPPGPGRNPRGGGDPNARSIIHMGYECGNDRTANPPSPDSAHTSADSSTVQMTDDAPPCFEKAGLARFLSLSVRTLDRLSAQGMLPPADLTISGSKRWLRSTISRWLLSKPKLSGRKGEQS
jgi:hypothetical protein